MATYEDDVVSEFLYKRNMVETDDYSNIRSIYVELVVSFGRFGLSSHTHGESACRRTEASQAIDSLGSLGGRKVVFYQGSKADLRNGREITRSHFWAKDQSVPPSRKEIGPRDIIAMVDVDYYVNLPVMMTTNCNIYVFYTFVPNQAAKSEGEYKYCWNSDQTIDYTVSGGGSYHHELWNYDGDSIKVVRKIGWFVHSVCTYLIERKRVDDDHYLILLVPLSKHTWFSALIADRYLAGRKLERLRPVTPEGFVRVLLNSKEGMHMSTGKVNCYSVANVEVTIDDEIASVARTAKLELTRGAVKQKMALEIGKYSGGNVPGAEILFEYHLTKAQDAPRLISILKQTTEKPRTFQWTKAPGDLDIDAVSKMEVFMKPIVDGAVVPSNCRNNDKRMVEERITNLQKKVVGISSFVERTTREFLELFIGANRGTLHPLSNEEVHLRQGTPTQRRVMLMSEDEISSDRTVDFFMKTEAYPKVTDPRGIGVLNKVDKRVYAAYIYALQDYMKTMPWYAFGLSNIDIACRVSELAQRNDLLIETDFSRMDGHINTPARLVELGAVMGLFDPRYHSDLYEANASQMELDAVTTNGVRFHTGLARIPGSMHTSVFNTLVNACVAYQAIRRTRNPFTGKYFCPENAWNMLGIYGGDDGLTPFVPSNIYEKAAAEAGQKLTAVVRKRGETVRFLARVYSPDVWTGDVNSCHDIKRAISKFHVITRLPANVSKERKLQEKSFAYFLSDKHTPVLGDFVSKAIELFPMTAEGWANLAGVWRPDTSPDTQYPNFKASWMVDLIHEQMPTFSYQCFIDWLDKVDAKTIFECPGFGRLELEDLPYTTYIDGDIIVSKTSDPIPEGIKTQDSVKQTNLNKRLNGTKPKSKKAAAAC
jgi:hypothetical protein